MRFVVGHTGATNAVYVVNGEDATNVSDLFPEIGQDLSVIARSPELLAKIESGFDGPKFPVSEVTPALPIKSPGKFICLGLNYVDHIKEGGYEIPDYPALFMRSNDSLMAAGEPMVRPSCSVQLDYEAELLVIVGKGGRHISEQDALSHVFGYSVFNDGSIREYQRKTHQWTPGKNFDQTGPIGPYVVTPDELPDGAEGLKIESRVGSEILQSANTSDMMWSVARTIATLSEFTTLNSGDYIAMGTPPGVGHAKVPGPRWLKPGEVIEIEIEGIGICANLVVDEADFNARSAAE